MGLVGLIDKKNKGRKSRATAILTIKLPPIDNFSAPKRIFHFRLKL
jgi:hypothetical protein